MKIHKENTAQSGVKNNQPRRKMHEIENGEYGFAGRAVDCGHTKGG
jgi:hypothetical protein